MTDKIAWFTEFASGKLDEIAECFNDGVKLTLVVRFPGEPESEMVLTWEDDFDAIIETIKRRQAALKKEAS